jgi:competence protein ComEA helix-hairpin-helix repeat region
MTFHHSPIPEFTRLRQKGLFIFVILILGFIGFQYWGMDQKPNLPGNTPLPERSITIELNGEVNRPSLIGYSQPTMVQQIIQDAGGFLKNQILSSKEGARILNQDTALTVTSKDHRILILQDPLSAKALWVLGRPIPINRATAEDLDRLPGIGPGLAQRIVEYRERRGRFSSLDELIEVNGIKEKTFEKIKGYLTL